MWWLPSISLPDPCHGFPPYHYQPHIMASLLVVLRFLTDRNTHSTSRKPYWNISEIYMWTCETADTQNQITHNPHFQEVNVLHLAIIKTLKKTSKSLIGYPPTCFGQSVKYYQMRPTCWGDWFKRVGVPAVQEHPTEEAFYPSYWGGEHTFHINEHNTCTGALQSATRFQVF